MKMKLTNADDIYFDGTYISNGHTIIRVDACQLTIPKQIHPAFYSKTPFVYKNKTIHDGTMMPDLQGIYRRIAESTDKTELIDINLMWSDGRYNVRLLRMEDKLVGIDVGYWEAITASLYMPDKLFFANNFIYNEDVCVVAPMLLPEDDQYVRALRNFVATL